MKKYQFSHAERQSLERLRAPFAVYQFLDKRVVTLILSDGFCNLFHYTDRRQAYYDMDHNMYQRTHPDDVTRIADAAVRFATQGGAYDVIYREKFQGEDEYSVLHAQGEHMFTEDGTRLAHVWYTLEGVYASDKPMDEGGLGQMLIRVMHEENMVQASQYDSLTGLPSMSYFFELAEAGRAAILREGGHPALLYMELSGLKRYNHKYGFAEGNKLLRGFADVLKRYFSNENCSRFGQDHFVAFTNDAGLEDVLRRLFADWQTANDGMTLPVRVGVYQDRMEAVDASIACDRAKMACDALRGAYASSYSFYSDALREATERKQYILENLDRAIGENWIQVVYQPIVRAANGRVCNEEALARWVDPAQGVLSPADFIPILEDARLIYKLDLYVVEQVLEKMRRQAEAGLYVMPHSANLSRADFSACDVVEEVRRRRRPRRHHHRDHRKHRGPGF